MMLTANGEMYLRGKRYSVMNLQYNRITLHKEDSIAGAGATGKANTNIK